MDEILQNLIKSYSETKSSDHPNKQFKLYSNLSTTQPLQQQCQLTRRIESGIQFLTECVLKSDVGLQSHLITESSNKLKTCSSEEKDDQAESQFDSLLNSDESDENSSSNNPSLQDLKFPLEIYTSILALDVLGDCESDTCGTSSTLNSTVIQNLIEFILPDVGGVSTFGIFKSNQQNDDEGNSSSRPNSAATTTSSTSSSSSSGCSSSLFDNLSDGCDHDQEDEKEIETIVSSNVLPQIILPPNDCNTTALALSVLLREGILDIKPTASVTELLLSNVEDVSKKDKHDYYPGVIRTFLGENGSTTIDAVSCANVLYLYYILTEDVGQGGDNIVGSSGMSLNFTENVKSTENFLLETLNNLLIRQEDDKDGIEDDKGGIESDPSFQLHPSPDALLYAVSRCTSISNEARNQFSEPLISLLDKRVGSSSPASPLSLAMRILSADSLGLLDQNGIWMRRKLEAECCKLAELQDTEDGGWPEDVMFNIGISNQVFSFGGRELTTIFAVRALQVFLDSVKDHAKFIPNKSYKYYGY